MAIPHEKLVFFSENYDLEELEYVEDYEAEKITSSSCGCFQGICLRWRTNNDGICGRYLLRQRQQGGAKEENWMVNKITRKVKQLSESEVLGRPKWKEFRGCFGMHGMNKKKRMLFQYDPQSYALNFDDGIHREVDGHAYHDAIALAHRCAASPPPGMDKGELGSGGL
ncbi:hypothetical protein FH972_013105 [Carpinus fangiana]|uniref:Uncharacterized protein n=1 Tax=Carpinus fangiana TaxID=176857 RepID=A0A5N6R5T4_9ROSI|nr:hypothetical protein FH972_013105 [Carpinus fangiana]